MSEKARLSYGYKAAELRCENSALHHRVQELIDEVIRWRATANHQGAYIAELEAILKEARSVFFLRRDWVEGSVIESMLEGIDRTLRGRP